MTTFLPLIMGDSEGMVFAAIPCETWWSMLLDCPWR